MRWSKKPEDNQPIPEEPSEQIEYLGTESAENNLIGIHREQMASSPFRRFLYKFTLSIVVLSFLLCGLYAAIPRKMHSYEAWVGNQTPTPFQPRQPTLYFGAPTYTPTVAGFRHPPPLADYLKGVTLDMELKRPATFSDAFLNYYCPVECVAMPSTILRDFAVLNGLPWDTRLDTPLAPGVYRFFLPHTYK
ncbi:hypothetical protein A3K63_01750 [Candidatus Micrarchaeota archaeon RBG_16_49_10]|nr:MAG: hypothetical protein A3K63_01750 [Candidatus Micrarchaeota archaeon RBG_16_49_10]